MASILVIEDDVYVMGMLRQVLEREGHEVTAALNGSEGLACYRERPADLVITDMIMPGKGGMETIMELRRFFPEVKLIAISGGGRVGAETHLKVAGQLGALTTFTKPVRLNSLLRAVHQILC